MLWKLNSNVIFLKDWFPIGTALFSSCYYEKYFDQECFGREKFISAYRSQHYWGNPGGELKQDQEAEIMEKHWLYARSQTHA